MSEAERHRPKFHLLQMCSPWRVYKMCSEGTKEYVEIKKPEQTMVILVAFISTCFSLSVF